MVEAENIVLENRQFVAVAQVTGRHRASLLKGELCLGGSTQRAEPV